MKRVKTVLFLMATMLLLPLCTKAATPSPTSMDIGKTSKDGSYYLEYKVNGWTYSGKFRYPKVTITLVKKDENGNVTKTKLKANQDFVFANGEGPGYGKHKIVTTHQTKIYGIGAFKGSTVVRYKVNKANSSFSTKVTSKTFTKKQLKKKRSFNIGVKYGKTTKSFAGKKIAFKNKTSKKLRKYITVSNKGKVTLKKGAKKGTYKIKVQLKGTKNYNGMTKIVTIKVK